MKLGSRLLTVRVGWRETHEISPSVVRHQAVVLLGSRIEVGQIEGPVNDFIIVDGDFHRVDIAAVFPVRDGLPRFLDGGVTIYAAVHISTSLHKVGIDSIDLLVLRHLRLVLRDLLLLLRRRNADHLRTIVIVVRVVNVFAFSENSLAHKRVVHKV